MEELQITLAIKGYDRHLPILSNRVQVKGCKCLHQEVKSEDRFHERMLHERPWDVSELSLSSYLMARAKGLPFTAIPVFPRRLFTHSQLYVNSQSSIHSPRELLGCRIGLAGGYAQSLAVWVKGDLQDEWGVGLDKVVWVTHDEKTGANFTVPSDIKVERTSKNLEDLLLSGEIQALVSSMMPQAVIKGDPRIRYLFENPYLEELNYLTKHHVFPIMHVIAAKSEIIARNPWIAKRLFDAFEEGKQLAYRYYREDPVWSLVAGVSELFQQQQMAMGGDAWPYGISRNRKYLERFMHYQTEQGLIDRSIAIEELFAEATLGT